MQIGISGNIYVKKLVQKGYENASLIRVVIRLELCKYLGFEHKTNSILKSQYMFKHENFPVALKIQADYTIHAKNKNKIKIQI